MVFRVKIWCVVAAAGLLLIQPLGGQLTDEEKRELFLKAREDIRAVPKPKTTPKPKPRPAATPRPKPKPESKPAPRPSPTPARAADDDFIPLEGEKSPSPARPEPSPEKPDPAPEKESPKPAEPRPSPKKSSAQSDVPAAPIKIEKSGLQEEAGYEPPAKKKSGGWFKRYRYLTPAVRRAIDEARVRKGRWRFIIIHNSGTRQGNAKIFDRYHRNTRKMKNGMAYHFVIGNGSSSGNGEIEIGSRWTKQINGGHVASDYLNDIAIGICLVGDLNRDKPTAAQTAALEELVDYLRGRVGKVKGKPAAVRGHKQINPKPTDCPGDRFDLRWLRRRFGW